MSFIFQVTKTLYGSINLSLIIIIILLTGSIVGFLSALIGVGGGIIWVPVLYSLFPQMPPQAVISTVLAFVMINSSRNAVLFLRKGITGPLFHLIFMGITMGVGVIIAKSLSQQLSPLALKSIFGIFLWYAAIKNLWPKKNQQIQIDNQPKNFSLLSSLLIALISGVVSGLTGLGGGIVLIPLFMTILHISGPALSFFSNTIMAIASFIAVIVSMLEDHNQMVAALPQFLRSFQIGSINLSLVILMSLPPIITAPLGIKLASKISKKKSQLFLSVILLFFAIKLTYSIIHSYSHL